MIDTFATFEDLSKHMTEGKDYRIVTKNTDSRYLIAAIHGGNIEPFTSDIASSIAGEEYDLYLFEGMREKGNEQLHIGSRYFDEPQLKDMIRNADVVVSIHGQANEDKEFVSIGGLSGGLVKKIIDHLQAIDITVREFEARMEPESPENICNRGMSGGGVELEISGKLRNTLQEDEGMHRLFVNAIRHAMEELQ